MSNDFYIIHVYLYEGMKNFLDMRYCQIRIGELWCKELSEISFLALNAPYNLLEDIRNPLLTSLREKNINENQ